MRRALIAVGAVAGLTLFGVAPAAYAAPADPVAVPDAALLECINNELGHGPTDTLTEGDAATVTQVTCNNKGIDDLTGMEFLTSITVASFNQNDVANLAPLAGLTSLEKLYLGYNAIVDVNDLAGLTSLDVLRMNGNSVSDVLPLSGLTLLTYLDLDGNSIDDISALSGLTLLTYLDLDGNSIDDVSALSGLTSLSDLSLDGNHIVDLSDAPAPIATFTATGQTVDLGVLAVGVEEPNPVVDAAGNPVALVGGAYDSGSQSILPTAAGPYTGTWTTTDFDGTFSYDAVNPVIFPDAALRECVNDELGQNPNDVISVSQAAGITDPLDCDGEGISDLTGMESLTGITELNLYDNDIVDLAPLAGLTSLENLQLSDNSIVDVSPLSGLTLLNLLYLDGNSIVDVSPLSGLNTLEFLSVGGNLIVDVAPLASLTSLDELYLFDNLIVDVSALSGLTGLETLDLAGNSIVDVSALSGLTGLEFLYVNQNAIVDISPLSGLNAAGSAKDQVVDLGELVVDVAAGNPVVELNGDPVALDSLYDSAGNTFTPTAVGAGAITWSDTDDYFTGTLNFMVVEEEEPGTDDGGDGTDTGTDVPATDGGDDDTGVPATGGGDGTDVPAADGDDGAESSDPELAETGLDAMGGGIAAAGLLLAGGLMIARTRFKLQ